jgi:hypothetical protein
MPNVVLNPLPPEVQAIIDLINDNVNTFLTNRERLTSYFDSSVGLSAWSLIPANNRTLLRDLIVTELNDALAQLQNAVNQTQQLS